MRYLSFFLGFLFAAPAFSQQAIPVLTGTWKVVSKIETTTTSGTITDVDKEIYKAGEKTYLLSSKTVTISQGFGKHKETLPLRIQGKQLFIGKAEKNKDPYIVSMKGKYLILTKTERKTKKGKNQVETEVVTLTK